MEYVFYFHTQTVLRWSIQGQTTLFSELKDEAFKCLSREYPGVTVENRDTWKVSVEVYEGSFRVALESNPPNHLSA